MHECCLSFLPCSIWLSATPDPASSLMGFSVTEIGHFYADSKYYTMRDHRKEYLMLYTLNGSGSIHTSHKDFVLPSHCATLLDCNAWHRYEANKDGWEFLWVHISGAGTASMYEAWELTQNSYVQIQEASEFETLFQDVLEHVHQNTLATLSSISLNIHVLLHLMTFKSHQALAPSDPTKQLIQASIHYIEQHYTEPLNIDVLAAQANLSKYHFIRKFKQYMGTTPYRYLLNYRINHSKVLLRTTKLSILEISSACGFLDDSNFIDHFKRQTGSTPSEYRKDFS